jgi:4-deoxy-L-threo-5-hexosulose-uronate ketol-isomerase
VPIADTLREIEVFDARPAVNRREPIVGPDTADLRFLRFARIALDPGREDYNPIKVGLAEDQEGLFYINRGCAFVTVNNERHKIGARDVIYLPIGSHALVESANGLADISEFRANECHARHQVQVVRHRDIEGTSYAAHLGTRRPSTERTVYKLVDTNVQACRLLFGDTYVKQRGAVGSYPPHFHGANGAYGLGENAKEEIYHFRMDSDIEGDTPFVLQNCARPGEPVGAYFALFDEQAVNVTPGYHDTMAPPAVDFMFSWCLASFTENNRDWGRIHNREGYEKEW